MYLSTIRTILDALSKNKHATLTIEIHCKSKVLVFSLINQSPWITACLIVYLACFPCANFCIADPVIWFQWSSLLVCISQWCLSILPSSLSCSSSFDIFHCCSGFLHRFVFVLITGMVWVAAATFFFFHYIPSEPCSLCYNLMIRFPVSLPSCFAFLATEVVCSLPADEVGVWVFFFRTALVQRFRWGRLICSCCRFPCWRSDSVIITRLLKHMRVHADITRGNQNRDCVVGGNFALARLSWALGLFGLQFKEMISILLMGKRYRWCASWKWIYV